MFPFAKKSLGQNFLTSSKALFQIVEAGEILPTDTVLEIGPGRGALTTPLLATGVTLYAVEKDDALIPILSEQYAHETKEKKFKLIHADILEWDRKEIRNKTYKLIANSPYYITGMIIRTFLETDNPPTHMVLLVQEEVALRIIARDNKESILSLSVKAYGTPKLIARVPRGAFTPSPTIDSAILQIKDITKKRFKERNITEKAFFDTLHAGFAHKRKRLMKNLEDRYTKETLAKAWNILKLDVNIRSEDMNIEQWMELVGKLQ